MLLHPVKVADLELSGPLATIEGLDGYTRLRGLVRLHGAPIGYVDLPVVAGRCSATSLARTILDKHPLPIIRHLLRDGLEAPPSPDGLRLAYLLATPHPSYQGPLPLVTVAVCTRDRAA